MFSSSFSLCVNLITAPPPHFSQFLSWLCKKINCSSKPSGLLMPYFFFPSEPLCLLGLYGCVQQVSVCACVWGRRKCSQKMKAPNTETHQIMTYFLAPLLVSDHKVTNVPWSDMKPRDALPLCTQTCPIFQSYASCSPWLSAGMAAGGWGLYSKWILQG